MALPVEFRDAINEAFKGRDTGPKSGCTRAGMKAFARDCVDEAVTLDEFRPVLKPGVFMGLNDPFGGGQPIDDLDGDQIHQLLAYAVDCPERLNAREAQARVLDALPFLAELYDELAA